MLRRGIEIVGLIILLVVPLLIVFQYEVVKLKTIDIADARESILHAWTHLQSLKVNNAKQLQLIQNTIESQFAGNHIINQQIQTIFSSLVQSQIPMSHLYSTDGSKYILNVQIATGFLSKMSQIKQTIMLQLHWLNEQFDMKYNITQWSQGMNLNEVKSNLIVIFRLLAAQSIDENIALKLRRGDYRNPYYIKEIVKQFRNTPSFSHCKFTNQQCIQTSIVFVKHNDPKEDSFLEVDQQMYFLDQIDRTIIFNVLTSIFHLDSYVQLLHFTKNSELPKICLSLIRQKQMIEQFERILTYLDHITKEHAFDFKFFQEKVEKDLQQAVRYVKNGQFVSPYMHTAEQNAKITRFLSLLQQFHEKPYLRLNQSLLDDNTVGTIDSFPNDFKIGVYLPLLVIFLYPAILLIKKAVSQSVSTLRTIKRE